MSTHQAKHFTSCRSDCFALAESGQRVFMIAYRDEQADKLLKSRNTDWSVTQCVVDPDVQLVDLQPKATGQTMLQALGAVNQFNVITKASHSPVKMDFTGARAFRYPHFKEVADLEGITFNDITCEAIYVAGGTLGAVGKFDLNEIERMSSRRLDEYGDVKTSQVPAERSSGSLISGAEPDKQTLAEWERWYNKKFAKLVSKTHKAPKDGVLINRELAKRLDSLDKLHEAFEHELCASVSDEYDIRRAVWAAHRSGLSLHPFMQRLFDSPQYTRWSPDEMSYALSMGLSPNEQIIKKDKETTLLGMCLRSLYDVKQASDDIYSAGYTSVHPRMLMDWLKRQVPSLMKKLVEFVDVMVTAGGSMAQALQGQEISQANQNMMIAQLMPLKIPFWQEVLGQYREENFLPSFKERVMAHAVRLNQEGLFWLLAREGVDLTAKINTSMNDENGRGVMLKRFKGHPQSFVQIAAEEMNQTMLQNLATLGAPFLAGKKAKWYIDRCLEKDELRCAQVLLNNCTDLDAETYENALQKAVDQADPILLQTCLDGLASLDIQVELAPYLQSALGSRNDMIANVLLSKPDQISLADHGAWPSIMASATPSLVDRMLGMGLNPCQKTPGEITQSAGDIVAIYGNIENLGVLEKHGLPLTIAMADSSLEHGQVQMLDYLAKKNIFPDVCCAGEPKHNRLAAARWVMAHRMDIGGSLKEWVHEAIRQGEKPLSVPEPPEPSKPGIRTLTF